MYVPSTTQTKYTQSSNKAHRTEKNISRSHPSSVGMHALTQLTKRYNKL